MEIPFVYMRGGSSKGCFFLKSDLPQRESWDDLFLSVMGRDTKQIDGLGGSAVDNNKIIIVEPSEREDADVEYLVAQVMVGKGKINYTSNCGNMSSAVGPFSIMAGLVPAREGVTRVRMFNRNTDKLLEEDIPVKDGKVVEQGDCAIAGVPGTAAELKLNFVHPEGAKTGKLFPLGSHMDKFEVETDGEKKMVSASVLDISDIVVFIPAEEVGLTGTETPEEVKANTAAMSLAECIRGKVCERLGMVESWSEAAEKKPNSPKTVLFSRPKPCEASGGKLLEADDMDLCARVLFNGGQVHKSVPITVATAIGGIALFNDCVTGEILAGKAACVRIGHPSGVMNAYTDFVPGKDGQAELRGVAIQRTARRIISGTVYTVGI